MLHFNPPIHSSLITSLRPSFPLTTSVSILDVLLCEVGHLRQTFFFLIVLLETKVSGVVDQGNSSYCLSSPDFFTLQLPYLFFSSYTTCFVLFPLPLSQWFALWCVGLETAELKYKSHKLEEINTLKAMLMRTCWEYMLSLVSTFHHLLSLLEDLFFLNICTGI